MSRIYGGFHFMFANLEGKRAGAAVAKYVMQNYLLRASDLPCLMLDPSTPGKLRFRLHGWPGVRYAIEAAPDFRQWIRLTETDAQVGGTEFEVDTQGGVPVGFYRAVELSAP